MYDAFCLGFFLLIIFFWFYQVVKSRYIIHEFLLITFGSGVGGGFNYDS